MPGIQKALNNERKGWDVPDTQQEPAGSLLTFSFKGSQGPGTALLKDASAGAVLPGRPASSLLGLEGDKGPLAQHRWGQQEAGSAGLDRGFLSWFLQASKATAIVLGQ